MKDCPNIYNWLQALFPDRHKYISFIGFLSIIRSGTPLEQTVIFKYATAFDEKLLEFFIMVIMKDHRGAYHIENEVSGSYWWKDAGKPWDDNPLIFQPAALPVTVDILTAAKEFSAFSAWLANGQKTSN